MTTWFLKECPKCGGDLYLDPLVSGDTVKCLQCGLEVKLSFLYFEGKPEKQAVMAEKSAGEEVLVKGETAARKKRKLVSLN